MVAQARNTASARGCSSQPRSTIASRARSASSASAPPSRSPESGTLPATAEFYVRQPPRSVSERRQFRAPRRVGQPVILRANGPAQPDDFLTIHPRPAQDVPSRPTMGYYADMTTLLLVEDDARIRGALRLALADEGYLVVEAATGEQALTHLGTGAPDPDVVLLDLMLPGMDGLQVCTRIRERGDLPIIMVTARTASHEVIAGLEAGADDYVTKPVDAGELAARIRALLRRTRTADQDDTVTV